MTEMSQVSEMSVATESPTGRDAGDSKTFHYVGIVLILLLLCAIIYNLANRSSEGASGSADDSGDGDADDRGNVGPSGTGGFVISKATTPASTKPFRRRKTPPLISTSPKPDNINENPDPPRPHPKARDRSVPDVIFCTVSYRALYEYQFPPDGLCTHLVYSDVVVYPNYVKSRLDSLDKSLDSFRAHAYRAQKTRHGVSFSYEYADEAATSMTGASTPLMSSLWSWKVYDYGMLYAYDYSSYLKNTSNVRLALLKALSSEQQKLKGNNRSPDLFLGVLKLDYTSSTVSQMTLLRDLANTYPITILIFITHFFMYGSASQPQPPTSLTGSALPVKLTGISANLSSAGIKKDVTLLTSFTLAINKYRMRSGWTGGTSGTVESFAPIRYYEACYLRNSGAKSGNNYAYISIKERQVLLMYDTSETLLYKIAEVFKTYAHPKHGVAIYDVDYDQYNTTCSTPDFYRLRQISRYLHS